MRKHRQFAPLSVLPASSALLSRRAIATWLATNYGLQYVGYYLAASAVLSLLGLLSIRVKLRKMTTSPLEWSSRWPGFELSISASHGCFRYGWCPVNLSYRRL